MSQNKSAFQYRNIAPAIFFFCIYEPAINDSGIAHCDVIDWTSLNKMSSSTSSTTSELSDFDDLDLNSDCLDDSVEPVATAEEWLTYQDAVAREKVEEVKQAIFWQSGRRVLVRW